MPAQVWILNVGPPLFILPVRCNRSGSSIGHMGTLALLFSIIGLETCRMINRSALSSPAHRSSIWHHLHNAVVGTALHFSQADFIFAALITLGLAYRGSSSLLFCDVAGRELLQI